MTTRTIRKAFATRGIFPFKPELVIEPLMEELGCNNCDLQIFDGVDEAVQISSDLPTSPLRNGFTARRSTTKLNNLLDTEKEAISPKLRDAIDRYTGACIGKVDLVGIMDNTLQNHLPKQPKIVRKSKRRVGRFGPLTTSDAIRRVAENIAKRAEPTKEDDQNMESSEGPEGLDTPVPTEKKPSHTIPGGEEVFETARVYTRAMLW